ncbi:MAG: hypothetical protein UZ17_ACD001000918 [Acidobacteria bacterium OLB17]|nr:MAG: hypothetical protein UZ17_ACD001000918 [Acidobacteria bacterium OLB17]
MFSTQTREFYAESIKKDSVKALLLSLIGFVCCPPVFAYFAWNTAQEVLVNIDVYEVEEGRRGMAQAAKVLAVASIILWVIAVIIRVLSAISAG